LESGARGVVGLQGGGALAPGKGGSGDALFDWLDCKSLAR